jgi:hypothetical protein
MIEDIESMVTRILKQDEDLHSTLARRVHFGVCKVQMIRACRVYVI